MKRLLCLCLVLCSVLLLLPSCGGGTGAGETAPATTEADDAPVYDVYFTYRKTGMRDALMVAVPTRENRIPVPPEGYDDQYLTAEKIGTFAGWDKELVAPTAENMANGKKMVYTARYTYETRYYAVTFRAGATEETFSLSYHATPTPEAPEAPAGQVFVGWDKEVVPAEGDTVYTAKFMSADCPSTFKVATWNIGHFANGNAKDSKIADADYETKAAEYRTYLSGLDADIVCLNEYSRQFTPNHAAKEALFAEEPPVWFIGEQRHFSCNAVYSKLPLQNLQIHEYECNKDAVLLYSNTNKAYYYYYVTGELAIGSETVHFVFTHLAFDEDRTPDTVCMAQIAELIELYKDVDHVVMMGDWNAYHKNLYDPFADAGYSLGNYGEILTCTGSRTGGLEWAVDDIIVKGMEISDFHAVNTGLSDHIAVVATLTLT
ncbi:MAG: endonuclease/exonuclease/phosphatase family protein, partial [Clostridia bacterium]|nr:endonuclease/exonuclease/phosphatase family protein [Clostridia bacterium]